MPVRPGIVGCDMAFFYYAKQKVRQSCFLEYLLVLTRIMLTLVASMEFTHLGGDLSLKIRR